jgi:heptosyltransferase-3
VLIVGGVEDVAIGAQIIAGRSSHVFNIAGRTTLGQLAALLQMSSMHLGIDSAAAHIAAAVGTPGVTIFGPGDWHSWTIVDDLHRVVTADLPCRPCNRKGCDDSEQSLCLDRLETAKVIAVVADMFASIPSLRTNPQSPNVLSR